MITFFEIFISLLAALIVIALISAIVVIVQWLLTMSDGDKKHPEE